MIQCGKHQVPPYKKITLSYLFKNMSEVTGSLVIPTIYIPPISDK